MNKNDLKQYMIVLGSDNDLGIRYKNSSLKGKRYYLVTEVNLEKGFFKLLYFSKKNMERESDNRYIVLDELPESVLRINYSPKQVDIKKVSHLTRETELSTRSIEEIKKRKAQLGINYDFW